eukprot:8724492-Ditylum_brightwellii.AAC.2
MELPIAMTMQSGNARDYFLRLNKSIYGLKQSSPNLYKLLSEALQKTGKDFKPSQADPCLFIKDDCVVVTYLDNVLIIGQSDEVINCFIKSLETDDEGFEFTREAIVENYLEVEIYRPGKPNDQSFEFRQPCLIKKFIELVGFFFCGPTNPNRLVQSIYS